MTPDLITFSLHVNNVFTVQIRKLPEFPLEPMDHPSRLQQEQKVLEVESNRLSEKVHLQEMPLVNSKLQHQTAGKPKWSPTPQPSPAPPVRLPSPRVCLCFNKCFSDWPLKAGMKIFSV